MQDPPAAYLGNLARARMEFQSSYRLGTPMESSYRLSTPMESSYRLSTPMEGSYRMSNPNVRRQQ